METFVSIMETLMVVCFGISWPLNIVKAWKSHSAKGISLPFYSLIWIGYVFALIGKMTLIIGNAAPWYETVHWYVMFFYILNLLMVSAGIGIYFRNKKLDSKSNKKSGRVSEIKANDNRLIVGGRKNECL